MLGVVCVVMPTKINDYGQGLYHFYILDYMHQHQHNIYPSSQHSVLTLYVDIESPACPLSSSFTWLSINSLPSHKNIDGNFPCSVVEQLDIHQSFACLDHKSVSHFSSSTLSSLLLFKYKAIKLNSRHFKLLKGNSLNPLEEKFSIWLHHKI